MTNDDKDTESEKMPSTRGTLPKKGFLDTLAKKADEIKDKSIELGKIAAREAEELGDKIDDAVDDSWDEVKKLKPKSVESKNETIDLIERLAKLKEEGIISEKEFNAKKKDLLDKI
ncbi:MAG: SHOCT domain-containing protein [Nitrosopumilus sp.]|nr:SHOCT domain-containing protein [Nitrosopumilus sp.]MDH3735894.1 SHOCT domain-containing protein [Nitrosopumilus sp.]MDH3822947.1 SHOCT domain-containing protein [Nitrosopumilus sp.]MDH3832925.1 SHOCT domain-containing protein [Nitrosopumilus sp.]